MVQIILAVNGFMALALFLYGPYTWRSPYPSQIEEIRTLIQTNRIGLAIELCRDKSFFRDSMLLRLLESLLVKCNRPEDLPDIAHLRVQDFTTKIKKHQQWIIVLSGVVFFSMVFAFLRAPISIQFWFTAELLILLIAYVYSNHVLLDLSRFAEEFVYLLSERFDNGSQDTDKGFDFPEALSDERPPPSGIFLCYRTKDSQYMTKRLRESLRKHFDDKDIFMAPDSIPMGVSYSAFIKETIPQIRWFIPVIGERWLTIPSEKQPGKRALDDDGDLVCEEIRLALERNIAIIPVYFENEQHLNGEDLPDCIRGLAEKQGLFIGADDYEDKVRELLSLVQYGSARRIRNNQAPW